MQLMRRLHISIFSVLMLTQSVCLAASDVAQAERDARVEQRLNQQIDLSLPFKAEDGRDVTLKDVMIPGRPAIIAPVYFMCPNLCTFTLNGVVESLNELKLKLGTDFSLIAFSINPAEGPDLAKEKAANYYHELKDPKAGAAGWRFLTGAQQSIDTLTSQLGFHYRKDGVDYIHASAVMVVTPEGKISRYFSGVQYPADEVRLALVDASRGRIGGVMDKAFLFCFRFDHLTGRYSLLVWNVVRAVSIGCALLLFAFLLTMRMKELRDRKAHA